VEHVSAGAGGGVVKPRAHGGHGTRMEAAAMGGGIFALRRAQYELKNSVKQS